MTLKMMPASLRAEVLTSALLLLLEKRTVFLEGHPRAAEILPLEKITDKCKLKLKDGNAVLLREERKCIGNRPYHKASDLRKGKTDVVCFFPSS